MIIDTYGVNVKFIVDPVSLRNVDRSLNNIQRRANGLMMGGTGVGAGASSGSAGRRGGLINPSLGGLSTSGGAIGLNLGVAGLNPVTAAIAAAGIAMYKTSQQSANMQKSLIAVGKVTPLTTEQLERMKDNLIAASTTTVSADPRNLLAYAEAAGTMGFTVRENLENVAVTMGKLELATKLSGFEATQVIGRIMSLTGEANENFDRFGSTIVELGNKMRTTDPRILSLSRLVAQGVVDYKVATKDVLGLSAAYSELGTRPENARTQLQRSFQAITTAATDPSSDAMAALQKVTGLAKSEIRDMYNTDQIELILKMGEGVNKLSEANQEFVSSKGSKGYVTDMVEIFKMLGMNDVAMRATLTTMGARSDLFRKSLNLARAEWQANQALDKESQAALQSLNVKATQLKNTFKQLADEIVGQDSLVWLGQITDGISGIIKQVTAAIAKFKEWYAEIDLVPDFVKKIGNYSDRFSAYTKQKKLDLLKNSKEITPRMQDEIDTLERELQSQKKQNALFKETTTPSTATSGYAEMGEEAANAMIKKLGGGTNPISTTPQNLTGNALEDQGSYYANLYNKPATSPVITNSGNVNVNVKVEAGANVDGDGMTKAVERGVVTGLKKMNSREPSGWLDFNMDQGKSMAAMTGGA